VGLVGSVDGKRIDKDSLEGPQSDAERLGVELAERLLKQGADVILREVYGANADTSGDKLLEN
jgi:hydroxymethylbilane synthase